MATGLVDLNRDGILDRVTIGWKALAIPDVKLEIGQGGDHYIPLHEVQKLKGAREFFEVGQADVRGFYVVADRFLNPVNHKYEWGLRIFIDIDWEFDKPLFPEPVFATPLFADAPAPSVAEGDKFSDMTW